MSARDFDVEGNLRKFWNDVARTYTEYDAAGAVVVTRPYTTDENARADAEAAELALANNQASIEEALSAALVTLQTIIDTNNNQISAPAAIKDISRALRRVIRLVIRRFDGTT